MSTADSWTSDLPTPSSALAIGAHPDDVEFGCGGTLAKWAADGCIVHHLVLTDGSKGTWDVGADLAELVVTRRDEQRDAARALGATGEVVFLDVVDGELDSTLERRNQVAAVIRRLRPAVVLGHDPWRRYRLHPDHRHAGWLTVDGCVVARDPHFATPGDDPHHRPELLLLFEADDPDHIEHLMSAGPKLDALLAHRSQHLPTMGIADDDDGSQLAAFHQRIVDRLYEHAALAGAHAPSALGEAFRRLPL